MGVLCWGFSLGASLETTSSLTGRRNPSSVWEENVPGASAEREEGRLAIAWWTTDMRLKSLCMPTTDLEPDATCPTSLGLTVLTAKGGDSAVAGCIGCWEESMGGVPAVWRHQCWGPAAVSPDKQACANVGD